MAELSPSNQIAIPVAKFIDDVEDFLAGRSADEAIKQLNENYQVYKIVEQELLQKKARLASKVPDIRKALEIVILLMDKQDQELTFDFNLAEQVFAKANVRSAESVSLWLGAGVMLEYPLDEAKGLLETNLDNAKQSLAINAENLDLIKDYTTTTEVSIARLYNHEVQQKKKRKELEPG